MDRIVGAERWVLQEVDKTSALVRAEKCPAKEVHLASLAAIFLQGAAPVPAMEDPDWWDEDRTVPAEIPCGKLLDRMGTASKAPPSRGMVFYVFRGEDGERTKVVNATSLARERARMTYKSLLLAGGGKSAGGDGSVR